MLTNDLDGAWLAVQVKERLEACAARGLRDRAYEVFLPQRSRRPDETERTAAALFPGYLFCRFSATGAAPIVSTPGVIRVVGIGRRPVPISEVELQAVRQAVSSGVPTEPCDFVTAGQPVRLVRGPLEGVEGLFVRRKDSSRLILSITLLQRSIAIEVDAASMTTVPMGGRCGN